MTNKDLRYLIQRIKENKYLTRDETNYIIKALEQEPKWVPVSERLAREYISKVKCCDECFASTFCTINGLRNSRVPQDYCIENVKKYFEDKASLTGLESEG